MHWIKFNLVGVGGFAVQTGALYFFAHNVHQMHYLSVGACSLCNFFLADRVIFTRPD